MGWVLVEVGGGFDPPFWLWCRLLAFVSGWAGGCDWLAGGFFGGIQKICHNVSVTVERKTISQRVNIVRWQWRSLLENFFPNFLQTVPAGPGANVPCRFNTKLPDLVSNPKLKSSFFAMVYY